jgi:hypothetical protein
MGDYMKLIPRKKPPHIYSAKTKQVTELDPSRNLRSVI